MPALNDPTNLLDLAPPRHVAIIMDGNGRWARQRGKPRYHGHRAGVESVRQSVESAIHNNVGVLTLYAFSRENWQRPEDEVGQLMRLFNFALKREARKLHKNGVRLRIIGERSRFSLSLRKAIEQAEDLTRRNTRLELVIAVNYSGRWDILQATQKLVAHALKNPASATEINEESLSEQLSLATLPAPDLFIRTGGEQRISNFYLWQIAYTELYFCETLWPDFGPMDFNKAVAWFKSRERRFGLTSDQLVSEEGLHA